MRQVSVGQESVMSDSEKPSGEVVQQEAPDELESRYPHMKLRKIKAVF